MARKGPKGLDKPSRKPKAKRAPQKGITLGQRLVTARLALDQGQLEFAQTLGITKQRLNNYERDLRPVDIDIAFAISKEFKKQQGRSLPLEWVLFGEEGDLSQNTLEALAKGEALMREKDKPRQG